ncbi:hypothetical protein GKE82_12210 [Conexibacter sp. W3-3-2]|nr:hypothetical protein [Conexibacter sp. W3-3-2]MTD45034.1 hypothetical protein [Conexibacter sp. W3-3-2]
MLRRSRRLVPALLVLVAAPAPALAARPNASGRSARERRGQQAGAAR